MRMLSTLLVLLVPLELALAQDVEKLSQAIRESPRAETVIGLLPQIGLLLRDESAALEALPLVEQAAEILRPTAVQTGHWPAAASLLQSAARMRFEQAEPEKAAAHLKSLLALYGSLNEGFAGASNLVALEYLRGAANQGRARGARRGRRSPWPGAGSRPDAIRGGGRIEPAAATTQHRGAIRIAPCLDPARAAARASAGFAGIGRLAPGCLRASAGRTAPDECVSPPADRRHRRPVQHRLGPGASGRRIGPPAPADGRAGRAQESECAQCRTRLAVSASC